MSPTFRTRRRIEFADTDMAGIVHFSNFFRFMESAEVDFLHSLGLSVKMRWEGESLGFPRVSAACDYVKPVRFEDVVEIAVTVEKVGAKSVSYAFEFSKDGETIARGRVTAVCCRVLPDNRLESVRIPDRIRQLLESAPALKDGPTPLRGKPGEPG